MNFRRGPLLLGVGILVVALVFGAFVGLDFHALESETTTESSIGTSQLGNATAPDEPLTLVVRGDDAEANELGVALQAALSPRFGSVTVTAESTPPWTGSVLVVAVAESAVQYNPISPSGTVSADFAYVGSGNATFATSLVTGDGPLVVTNRELYVSHGTVTVTDRSRGLVSVPGYRSHLRDALAAEMSRSIGSAPGMD